MSSEAHNENIALCPSFYTFLYVRFAVRLHNNKLLNCSDNRTGQGL